MAKTKPPAPATVTPSPSTGYTVVARRYRPQQFSDLIGQEHVAGALTNALASGRIAHAYLFTGARGVGKTSTARILAKALNCTRGPTTTPCDQCDSCQAIAAGEDVDVVEIDAASNTGVDNIRELRQNVGFRPQRARFKIYIIDEVHMLSNSAFNALLKTLEEPPPHVKFIFATTEAQKIPITILSRCQRFDFAHIGPQKVFETLQHIVRKEGLAAEDAALRIVAKRAGGSMRDAQTLLDQLLGATASQLTAEAVHALLGTAGEEWIDSLATAILERNGAEAVRLVGQAADRGYQLGELIDQLIDYWRGLMLLQVAGPEAVELSNLPGDREKMSAHATHVELDAVLAGLDVLTTAKARMRNSSHIQVLAEVAIVRLTRLSELLAVGELLTSVAAGTPITPTRTAPPGPSRPVPRLSSAPETPESLKKNGTLSHKATPQAQTPEVAGSETVAPPAVTQPMALTTDTLAVVWERILQAVGPMRGNQLRQAENPAIIGPNALEIRFSPRYSAAYDACSSEASLGVIRTTVKKVTGTEWQVRVVLDRLEAAVVAALPPRRRPAELGLLKKAAEAFGLDPANEWRVDEGFDPTTSSATWSNSDADSDEDDAPAPESDSDRD
ncbi:MAG: DNA polymerase III subunit gamma/tau [Bacteroidales bacterium]|nr:DNA polymerase III subunit gamma/tau [Bacteroidales bacterium]